MLDCFSLFPFTDFTGEIPASHFLSHLMEESTRREFLNCQILYWPCWVRSDRKVFERSQLNVEYMKVKWGLKVYLLFLVNAIPAPVTRVCGFYKSRATTYCSLRMLYGTPLKPVSSNLEKFLSISISRVYSLISHCVAVLTVRSLREHMLRHLTDSGTVSLVKAGGCFSNSQFASVISNVNQSFGFKRLDKI